VVKYGGVVDSHATSNLAISDEQRGKTGLKLRVSLLPNQPLYPATMITGLV